MDAFFPDWSVVIYSLPPKVGDTIRVLIYDEEGNEINPTDVDAKIQWYANGVALLDETDAEIYVSSNMAGAVLSVIVTIDDEKLTDATKAVAGEDKSAEVELVDDYGLQSDGTGIIGDVLTVTYGADFGTPTNVSWYKNGKVVATNSVGDGVNAGLSREIVAGGRFGVGTYKVTITNTDGEMATTNEIVITDKEEAATITDFAIEDDYTDGTDITYNAQDRTAVATVTLSKNYAGTIAIYKKSDTKYTARVDRIATTTDGAWRTAAVATADQTQGQTATAVRDNASELCSTPATNYQVLNVRNAGSGYGYINDDGSVTYKFRVNDGALTRGTEYVVVFDQTSISTDTPSTGKANVYDKAVAVPYVQVPAKIAVTKVSAGNAPQVTFYDEKGNVLEWLGSEEATTAGAFDSLEECGIASAQVYSATIKTNDTSKGTARGAGIANKLVQGVWTSGQVAPDPIDAYWFAQVKTTAGVYGSGQVTLLSEPVPAAQDSASDMDLIENKDTATTATVSFSNLRSSGTVYIVKGYWDLATNGRANPDGSATYDNTGIAVEDHASAVDKIFAGFDRDDSTTYVATAKVTAGTEKVDIANAISKVTTNNVANNTTTAQGDVLEGLAIGVAGYSNASAVASGKHFNNNYIAVFIPDDEVNYGMIYTNGALGAAATSSTNSTVGTNAAAKSPLQITQELKTYSLNGKFGSTNVADSTTASPSTIGVYRIEDGNLANTTTVDQTKLDGYVLTWKDQFGEAMLHPANNTGDKVWHLLPQVSTMDRNATMDVTYDANAFASTKAANNGIVYDSLSFAGTTTTPFKNGDVFSAKLGTGQTLTLTCQNTAAAAAANSTWKVTLS